jgi:arabinan endo-1,5-alpha-L-arabinosidase
LSQFADAGGYPGSPYFKITIAGTTRTLAVTEGDELVALPDFTGSAAELWRFDQLADGNWRIMPKAIPKTRDPFVLSAVGSSFATLAKFDNGSEKQRWLIKTP